MGDGDNSGGGGQQGGGGYGGGGSTGEYKSPKQFELKQS